VRLADTDLWVQVEADDTEPGEGCSAAAARPPARRAGVRERRPDSQLDMIVLGVLLLDPILGVRKTNMASKDGRVGRRGRAGTRRCRWASARGGAHTAMSPARG